METLEIYQCRVKLDKNGWRTLYEPIYVEETEKMYKNKFQRINKDKILKIDTIFVTGTKTLNFFTYCLKSQKKEAENLLKSHIIGKLVEFKNDIDVLYSFL